MIPRFVEANVEASRSIEWSNSKDDPKELSITTAAALSIRAKPYVDPSLLLPIISSLETP